MPRQDIFDRLVWQPDRMLLDGLVFRLQHYKSDNWSGGEHFMFFKIKKLVDEYEHYFRRRSDFCPNHVVELGMFDGGSVAFWNELFRPQKHVALDRADRSNSLYFERYVDSHGLSERIRTFWNTDQADKTRLRELIATEFDGPLDLVIDDASHFYGPTLASFETLFPALAPGGLYIIEDWAWGHWPEFNAPDHPWAQETPLTQLVINLIEATGTSKLITDMVVYQGFISVERGPLVIDNPASFTLESHIFRRQPKPLTRASVVRRIARAVKQRLKPSHHT